MNKKLLKYIISMGAALALTAVPMTADFSLPVIPAVSVSAAGTVITADVSDGGYIGSAVQSALDEAASKGTKTAPVTVKIPKGSYTLDKTLHMYSNTYLDATGATIKSDATEHNMVMLGTNGSRDGYADYNSSEAVAGYGALKNIKITGGTWVGNDSNTNTFFRLAHATNVTLENMTITGGNYSKHQIEIAAINGFYVHDCTFKDYQPHKNMEGHFECIQIDTACNDVMFKLCYLDGLPSKNIEITGCTFKNVSRGLGTHSQLVGCYHDNVTITDNTFTNIAGEAIVALNYKNCTIARNTITNAGGGIRVENGKFLPDSGNSIDSMYTTVFNGTQAYTGKVVYNVNTVVKDNIIDVVYSKDSDRAVGIRVHGLYMDKDYYGRDGKKIAKKNYYISGVTVDNNTITTQGYGIYVDDARKTAITNNTITQTKVNKSDELKDKYDGIFVLNHCRTITISKNKIDGFVRNGIFLMADSKASKINSNKITKAGADGIHLVDKSSGGSITSNTINSPKEHGIFINTNSKASSISSNKVSSCKGIGIYVRENSSVSGNIKGNTVTGAKITGITLNMNSSAAAILSNTVSKPASHGISVTDKSKVTNNISSNTVTSAGNHGIFLNSSSKAKGILKNTVTSPKGSGIFLYDKSSLTGNISTNKISGAGSHGIVINTSAKVKGILKNTVTKSKLHGIYLYSKSTVTTDIKSNKVSSSGEHGIVLNTSSKVRNILSNTVKSSKRSGIYLYGGSIASGNIESNKISKSGENGIFLNTDSKVKKNILKNTISTSGNDGINLYTNCQVSGSIKSNKISGSKYCGIVLNGKCKASAVTSNTVKNTTRYGIFVYDKSTVGKQINKNKITKAYDGISVAGGSKVKKGIAGNTVKKASDKKIAVSSDSKAKIK
ncbi:MAG: right-handed parallel beta-helix repeat-containing protein [Ruminococcus sp.]|nr:right-handed parallel beta-helix repeat-containing protein [Ruminococcus sp.]